MQELDTKHADVGRIFGGYRVLGLLGRGGMGLVYLCEHVQLGHRMALKRLKRHAVNNPESLERFLDEVEGSLPKKSSSPTMKESHPQGKVDSAAGSPPAASPPPDGTAGADAFSVEISIATRHLRPAAIE